MAIVDVEKIGCTWYMVVDNERLINLFGANTLPIPFEAHTTRDEVISGLVRLGLGSEINIKPKGLPTKNK